MDDRFPKFLRIIVDKMSFIGLPNLGMFIAALAVMGFIGQNVLNAPMDRFIFDPQFVLQGEWWRLFAFPVSESLRQPIWLLFYVMYVYFVMNALEQQWGPGPLTVFTLFSYLCVLAAAFILDRPASVWFHVMENVSLAFGTLFPEMELYLFFVLPVKAKWLAMFAGALLIFQAVTGGGEVALFIFIVMLPYLTFFGPMLVYSIRNRRRLNQHKSRFNDDDMWRR